jgi:hypothetical protein
MIYQTCDDDIRHEITLMARVVLMSCGLLTSKSRAQTLGHTAGRQSSAVAPAAPRSVNIQ